MCGIHVSISKQAYCRPNEYLLKLLRNRGPDHFGKEEILVGNEFECQYYLCFISTVLALRGEQVTHQPFKSLQSSSIFCWNGEAWMVGAEQVGGNDGKLIFDLLIKACSAQTPSEGTVRILGVLRSISGPFAFVFFDHIHKQLYFGRDRLGRRSLLFKKTNSNTIFELCSISDPFNGPWFEVEADGIYQLSMTEEMSSVHYESLNYLQKHSWASTEDFITHYHLGLYNPCISKKHQALDIDAKSVDYLYHYLKRSLQLRISQIPSFSDLERVSVVRVAILFSGGLDCTVLARIAHEILPCNQEIDLLNVAFENPRVTQVAKSSALFKRHRDLVESPNCHYESCPDRKTGRRSLIELRKICSERLWRFVAINVPYTETVAHRKIVVDLIYPHNTEMDLSIAYAFYFASRGVGLASVDCQMIPTAYVTPARVLLSGLGADELFGGYTRHSTAFSRRGLPGLVEEMKLDLDRLGKRNLGRDDRIVSNWGKEVRLPFLDEALVKWAIETPISEKCGFGSPVNSEDLKSELEPGKLIIRLLSHKLGMISTAMEKKRAVQFGTRTAKMTTGNVKGTTLIK